MRKCVKRLNVIAVCVVCACVTACGQSDDVQVKDKQNEMMTTVFVETTSDENRTTTESISLETTTTEENTTKVEVETKYETATTEETTVENTTEIVTTTEAETTTVEETTTEMETTTALVVTDMDKLMYAKSSVNVRSGPSTDYEKIGSLKSGQQVKVTGKAEVTGWYRIEFNNTIGYVSGNYLQDQPVPETTTQAASSSAEKLLNGAVLNPKRSDFDPMNEYIDQLFAEIIKPDMTTYQKVKACYDYLINNCSYGHNEYVYDYIEAYFFYGYQYEVSAYGMLKGHIGVCDDYSATFAMLMQAIGLDCYVVGGQTTKASGGYTPHAWCEMNIDGVIYVFDPQVEDNIAKGGAIKYYRFCKTYEQVPSKYIKAE